MTPVGDYELKGIDEPVSVVRIEWDPDQRAGRVDLPTAVDVARSGPFVGRDLLVADLYDSQAR